MSIWRYSHLTLAVSSFLFLFIAAVTGVILSIEPIEIDLSDESVAEYSAMSLSEMMTNVSANFDEVFSIKVDGHDRVIVDGMTGDDIGQFYVDPSSGTIIGPVDEQAPVYQFATTLHRSLFLGTAGRIMVGVCSLAMLLIVLTGLWLIARKQGGWRNILKAGTRENTAAYYHTVLSKVFFIPLALLAVTGLFMSLDRFFDISHYEVAHQYEFPESASGKPMAIAEIPLFQQTTIADLRLLEFPFSSDPEDYYTVSLTGGEILLHQYKGTVMSQFNYPVLEVLANTIFAIHVGSINGWWSVLIGLSSLTIPFFMVTGFVVNRRRGTDKIQNTIEPADAEFVVLFGSENGSTQLFAHRFHQALLDLGKSSICLPLNDYQGFGNMRQLIIFTSTYGLGEAPASASSFLDLLEAPKEDYNDTYQYAVLGFGSTAYHDFCGFAKEVDRQLMKRGTQLLPLHTVNNGSVHDFKAWLASWKTATGLSPEVGVDDLSRKKRTTEFEVQAIQYSPNTDDGTFLLRLQSVSKRFQSGDLLAIYAPGEDRERYYSLAKVANKSGKADSILLSIKKHEQGICSSYLSQLSPGDRVEAYLVSNKHFHLPKAAGKVIMICNGTGIAPFLGMIRDASAKREVFLYWGGQNTASASLYQPYLEGLGANTDVTHIRYAFSRQDGRNYVQDLVAEDRDFIAATLADGGVVMACGSLAMYQSVAEVLSDIAENYLNTNLAELEANGQVLQDCY